MTLSSSNTAGAILIAIVIAFTFRKLHTRWNRYNFSRKNGCKPATHFPHRDPFLGLDFFIQLVRYTKERRRMESTKDLFDKFGCTWQVTSFGREIIHTIDPVNIQSVMAQDFDSWGLEPLRYPAAGPFMGRGVFTSDGPFWQHTRAQVKPVLTKAQFTDYQRLEFHLHNFFALLPQDGGNVDVIPLLERMFTDTVTEFLLGESVNTLTGRSSIDHQAFLNSFTAAAMGTGRRVLLGKLRVLFPRDKKFDEACKSTHKFLEEQIDKTFASLKAEDVERDQETGPLVFLRELAKQTDDRVLIRDQVLNVLNAANDGAAIVISNIIFLLSRHSEVQVKLREEVETIGMEKPDYDMIKKLKYLRCVINESLRIYPLVPTNGRMAVRDTILPTGGGPDGKAPIFVTKGTVYQTNSYVLHRNTEIWGPDAEVFRPERWETYRQGWEYQAFGGGARICPGQAFVLSEISYVVVRLLQEFRSIESRDAKPWVENMKLTMSNANGVVVGLVR